MSSTSVPFCLVLYISLSHLSPPLPCLSLAFCLLLFHIVFFVILVSLTTGTEMVLEAQRCRGGYSPVVHVKAAVFPISPRVPEFFFLFSPPLCVCPRLLLSSQYRCHHVQQLCLSTPLHRPSHRGLFRAPINHFSLTD